MQTIESLMRELQKFPPNTRCYAYEGEGERLDDGTVVHSYIVVTGPEPLVLAGGGRSRPIVGIVPCTENDALDGPAIERRLKRG